MTVLNKYKHPIPPEAVYIGRGSQWGNPYSHLKGTSAQFVTGSRDEACDKHNDYLKKQILSGEVSLEALAGLHNKDLVCYCAPARCHGDTLVKAAEWAFTQLLRKHTVGN